MNELEKLESVYADAQKSYEVVRDASKVAKVTHYEYQAAYEKAWNVANDAAMAINSYHLANRE